MVLELRLACAVGLVSLLAVGTSSVGAAPNAPSLAAIRQQFSRRPVSFEENRGQLDKRVRFVGRSGGSTVFLTQDEAVMLVPMAPAPSPGGHDWRKPVRASVLRMKFAGASRAAALTGLQRQPGVLNDLRGRRSPGVMGIRSFSQVRYAGLYPGTDLVFYGNRDRLEYDFVLKPGADPRRIRLSFQGASRLTVASNGDLVATTPCGDVRLKRPYAYQSVGGRRVAVACAYDTRPAGRGHDVSFRLARYDAARPLVVDPELAWGSRIGGRLDDTATAVACDLEGNAYVAGNTYSADFPGGRDGNIEIRWYFGDMFLTKFAPWGEQVWSNTFGGWAYDNAYGVALGNYRGYQVPYVVGQTMSLYMAHIDGMLGNYLGSPEVTDKHGFLLGFWPGDGRPGMGILIVGADEDCATSVTAVDDLGDIAVAGYTASTDFPFLGAGQGKAVAGRTDGFVARLDWLLRETRYVIPFGGSGSDRINSITADASGAVHVVGTTDSTDLPVTPGAAQRSYGGGLTDGFAAKIGPDGSTVAYCTYLGGAGTDSASGIALDADGVACVAGTAGAGFPTTWQAYQRQFGGGNSDAFAVALSADGTSRLYSTYLGGAGDDEALSLAATPGREAIVSGTTHSKNFPVTPGAFQTTNRDLAVGDSFISRLDPSGGSLLYSTYPDGDRAFETGHLAIDSVGRILLAGSVAGYQGTGHDVVLQSYDLRRALDLSVTAGDCLVGTTTTLTAKVTRGGLPVPVARQAVTFLVDDVAVNGTAVLTGSTGIASVTWSCPAGASLGYHSVVARTGGDPDYTGREATARFRVRRTPSLTVPETVALPGVDAVIRARFEAGGAPVSDQPLTLTVDSVAPASPGARTSTSGDASWTYQVPAAAVQGAHPVEVTYAGSDHFAPVTAQGTLWVPAASALRVPDLTGAAGTTVQLKAMLTSGGSAVAGGSIAFTAGGAAVPGSPVTTGADGTAVLAYAVPVASAGTTVTLAAAFAGSGRQLAAVGSGLLTVPRRATGLRIDPPAATAAGAYIRLKAYLAITADSAAVAGRAVRFTFNRADAGSAITGADGAADLLYLVPASSAAGTREVRVDFAGDTSHSPCWTTASATVNQPKATVATAVCKAAAAIGSKMDIAAVLFQVMPRTGLASKRLELLIDGQYMGFGITGASGGVGHGWKVPEGFAAGSHTYTCRFLGDSQYCATSSSVGFTTVARYETYLQSPLREFVRGQAANMKATLRRRLDDLGLAGKQVTFTIDGKVVGTAMTGTDGVASVAYTYPANGATGSRSVSAAFAGDEKYLPIDLPMTITAR